jgi:hypothetical protein
METLNQKLDKVIGTDGVKIDVGFNTTDTIYLSVAIIASITIALVLAKIITNKL